MTAVMYRFRTSVVERAASCLESVFPFCPDASVEIVYEVLSVCTEVLSGETFLEGEKAFEALQAFSHAVMESVRACVIVRAVAAIAARAGESRLATALEGYCGAPPEEFDPQQLAGVAEAAEAFHPDHVMTRFLRRRGSRAVEVSVERLSCPGTCLDEADAVVARAVDGAFGEYTDAIRQILQAAWVWATGKTPSDIDPELMEDIATAQREIAVMDEVDPADSKYGVAELERAFVQATDELE